MRSLDTDAPLNATTHAVWQVLLATLLIYLIGEAFILSDLSARLVTASAYQAAITSEHQCDARCVEMPEKGNWAKIGNSYRLPLILQKAGNPFQLAKDIESGRFKMLAPDTGVSLQVNFQGYRNSDEIADTMEAAISVRAIPRGPIHVDFENDGKVISTVEIRTLGGGNFRGVSINPPIAGFLLMLLSIGSTVVEFRKLRTGGLGLLPFVAIVRLAVLLAFEKSVHGAAGYFSFAVLLLPWFAIIPVSTLERLEARRTRLAEMIMPGVEMSSIPSPLLEFGMLFGTLAVFGMILWHDPGSFRWGIFEERDFLKAQNAFKAPSTFLYGPELLNGGRTPGGALYLLLAPIVRVWSDPIALSYFNRILFLATPVVLWRTVRLVAGRFGAVFSVLVFCASARAIALAYWPIHPDFSLFFAFVYVHLLMRGVVLRSTPCFVLAGLVLGFLVQLHFSYWLLFAIHILVVSFSGLGPRLLVESVAAFFLPLAPYLVADGSAGFANVQQIIGQPRFQPYYSPTAPLANQALYSLSLQWLAGISGPGLRWLSVGFEAAAYLGIIGILWPGTWKISRAGLVTLILLCGPLLFLALSGMGYAPRHSLALVPGLFLMVGIGGEMFLGRLQNLHKYAAGTLLLMLFAIFPARVFADHVLDPLIRSEGEWAVDYRDRTAVEDFLIEKVGLRPDQYDSRVFWWWMGWAIDPAQYRARFTEAERDGRVPTDTISAGGYVLATDSKKLPPLLANAFTVSRSDQVDGVTISRVVPKDQDVPPSGNADTGVLQPIFLQQIDLLHLEPERFARLYDDRRAGWGRQLFVGSVGGGRIKLVLTTETLQHGAESQVRWCLDSPSLDGQYWEIKTLWRPRLIFGTPDGKLIETSLAAETLGSLLYKTPRCGMVQATGGPNWSISLALSGTFDESAMIRPSLREQVIEIDTANSTVMRLTSALEKGWLDRRFGFR